ncbi:hypothetical protein CH369_11955 [Leptospira levettii]|nr:hypothetical protein CH369_11955 [Leptospira levettii]PKA27443.1 hypothetical protein CH381_05620 [Leptospira sp. mixed culture ATI2-C-A1]
MNFLPRIKSNELENQIYFVSLIQLFTRSPFLKFEYYDYCYNLITNFRFHRCDSKIKEIKTLK